MLNEITFFIFVILMKFSTVSAKYIEGELNTNDNWAFLTRFCFLNREGEFEYIIEFNEENGNPNLLLYYDTQDQWPSVYKTNKSCYEKESVLSIKQNQIINLTLYNERYGSDAGCIVPQITTTTTSTTPTPKITINIPTRKTKPTTTSTTTTTTTTPLPTTSTSTASAIMSIHYTDVVTTEQFWYNSTEVPGYQSNPAKFFESTTDVSSTSTKAPIRKRHVSHKPPPKGNRVLICQNARRFQSSRERWWFVAISNCNSTKGIHIKYQILMTNGDPGDYWHEHFSADQFYILPILITFSVGYSLLMLGILICTVELKSRQLLHTTYKLFVLSVIIQFFGIILQTAAFLKYAVNGMGAPTAKMFGNMLMGCSETCFLLLLLLLAKGYTVTRGRLPLGGSVKLTIFMCLYSVTYICIFIYEAQVFDPGEVLYLYESPAGYGLIILRIIAWLMFIYSTVFTLKHYPEKSLFYYPFNICGTLWFIAGPAFILSANTYIDKWVRESVVCGVLLLITFGGHLMFLMLTMPSMANKNFPYHVRTSQIGIMEITGAAGASTIERFGHHVYEPTPDVTDERVIIPLTRRTEDIFGGIYEQQRHIVPNMQLQNHADLPEEILTSQNVVMQNVISWSLAKNYAAFDVSRNERLSQRSFAFSESQNSEETPRSTNSHPSSAQTEIVENGVNSHNSYEYVKEVPVELFTISKPTTAKKDSDSVQ